MQEAPLLARVDESTQANVLHPTEAFIDAQTLSASVSFVSFASQVGIVTITKIEATFAVTASVSRSMSHLTALLPHELAVYQALCALALAVCVLSGTQIITKLVRPSKFGSYYFGSRIATIDALLLCVLPATYLIAVLLHSGNASEQAQEAASTMLAVPWAATDVEAAVKWARYQSALRDVEDLVSKEAAYQALGVVIGSALLLRLIAATDAHPRIGVLVRTVWVGIDELWHFLILVLILYASTVLVAYVAFGASRFDFRTIARTWETLINVTLGSWPSEAMDNIVLLMFLMFFLMINFFLILNFISKLRPQRRSLDARPYLRDSACTHYISTNRLCRSRHRRRFVRQGQE